MENTKTLTPPRMIAEQFEKFGFDYAIGDGLCIGLGHDKLESPVYIDFDEDYPTEYRVEGHYCYSVEEALDILQEISEDPESFGFEIAEEDEF